jgi:F420H(2)-dependent quinone reductase
VVIALKTISNSHKQDPVVDRKLTGMTIEGTYVPTPSDWVREQVELYERTGGREGNTLRETGIPIIVLTVRGAKTGFVRKFALMRVEHDGAYALVASKGGAPTNPAWLANLRADPDNVWIQDGDTPVRMQVRELEGDEYGAWWKRAVAVFPTYDEYKAKTDRRIVVLVATPV